MKSLFLSSLFIAGSAYAAFCILLYVSQRGMMYLPSATTDAVGAEAIKISSGDETLKIWGLGTGADAIIYFGGNAENVAWNIPSFSEYFPGYSIYLVNYRGYGGSTGSPSEAGFYTDALKIYDVLESQHRNIYVIGRSIGAAVATYLAAERQTEHLVLITPFDSALNMAREIYPFVPVKLLLKDRLDATIPASRLSTGVSVIVAGEDSIVPRARSEALIKSFQPDQIKPDRIEVRIIERADHNDIDGFADYKDALIASLPTRK